MSINITLAIDSRLTKNVHCLFEIKFNLLFNNLFYNNKYITNALCCVSEEEKTLVVRIRCSNWFALNLFSKQIGLH